MKTEIAQFIKELREKYGGRSSFFIEDFLSYLPTQNFSMQQFAALRHQHGMKKYVSLSELINFIEVLEITGDFFWKKKFNHFFFIFVLKIKFAIFFKKAFMQK